MYSSLSKSLLLILLTALAVSVVFAAPPRDTGGKLYGRQIVVAADASKDLQESAKALAHWLNKVTGAEYPVVTTPGKQGIFLVLDSGKTVPPIDLKPLKAKESNEAFLIYSADANRLWIVGKSEMALDHGIYWYLDKLGCRWLLPNEHWTVIPRRSDITLKVNSVQSPAFAARNFFGTGGWGRPAIDFWQKINESWEQYKRQNLLGGTFTLGGHAGEAFNNRHKKELAEHPEYLAEINGQRRPFDPGTKPCYSNPGLQALYVKDRVDEFRNTLKNTPSAMSVSVEPSDGGGHCECADCRKIGSVSDRVFSLANLVAKAVAKEFPGKYVNLYAYNEHAMVPSIPVEPNVIVSLAPYAFQRTGLSAEELIKVWGEKAGFMGMYDYWCIPDWSYCQPELSPKTVVDKIRFWQQNHVKIYLAESTFCGGNMGLNWYLASRLLWDPAKNEKAIVDDFFDKAFGAAQAPIRDMYLSWGENYMLTDHELGICYRDLQKALALTADPAIRARIIDLGRYIHYLRLYYEYSSTASADERKTKAKAIIDYDWSIYWSNMVQVFRIGQLLIRDARLGADQDVSSENPKWKDYRQLSDDDVLPLLADGAAKYQSLDFEMKRFSQKLVPVSDSVVAGPTRYIQSGPYGGGVTLIFAVSPQQTGRQVIRIYLPGVPGKADKVTVTDPTGKVVLQRTIPAEGRWVDIDIPTATAGQYRFQIFDQKNQYSLETPANLPLVCTGPFTCTALSGRTYFFVPTGTRKAAIYSPGVIPLKLYDPEGKAVKVDRNERGNALFLIDIPAGQDGKCWSFASFKSWSPIRLLNLPNVFAYSPESMMVPEEIKPKAGIRQ